MSRLVQIAALTFFLASSAAAQLSGPASQLLIPIAGNADGANGTYFHSDITITNLRTTDQQVQILWLAQSSGSSATPTQPVTLTIPALRTIGSEDFATQFIPCPRVCDSPGVPTGIGSLLVTSVSSKGLDSAGALAATERIWTKQTGSNGTVSQTLPSLDVSSIKPTEQAMIFGQRVDTRYRTNVGIVNLDPVNTRVFQVLRTHDRIPLVGPWVQVVVGPLSMMQVRLESDPPINFPMEITVWQPPDLAPPGATNRWVAFASSIDNVTGGAWSNLAVPLPAKPTDPSAPLLPVGCWSSSLMHEAFSVTDQEAQLGLGCGWASFARPAISSDGTFEAVGDVYLSVGGSLPHASPARFFGQLSGNTITLTIDDPYVPLHQTYVLSLNSTRPCTQPVGFPCP